MVYKTVLIVWINICILFIHYVPLYVYFRERKKINGITDVIFREENFFFFKEKSHPALCFEERTNEEDNWIVKCTQLFSMELKWMDCAQISLVNVHFLRWRARDWSSKWPTRCSKFHMYVCVRVSTNESEKCYMHVWFVKKWNVMKFAHCQKSAQQLFCCVACIHMMYIFVWSTAALHIDIRWILCVN